MVALLGIIALERGFFFLQGVIQLRAQQAEIEMGTRARIGEWLKSHGQPGERVFLEPIGYIGYFSGMRILDNPGLVCPEVVQLRRSGLVSFGAQIEALRPEWVVLRQVEGGQIKDQEAWFKKNYKLVKVFDARERLEGYGRIPGMEYLLFDAVFLVFRRTDLTPLPPEPSGVDYGSYEKRLR
jgi:hypothetical protein